MSPKELQYIEDTLGHEKQMSAVCTESATQLSDEELKNFVSQISARHSQCFSNFYNLLSRE